MSRLLDNLLLFGRVLRRAGIDVHRGRLLDVIEALGHVNLGARDEVYHTCRTLLVHRQEQIAVFDRAFAAFWRAHHGGEARSDPRPDESRASAVEIEEVLAPDEFSAPSGADEAEGDTATTTSGLKTWSDLGGLADKDFAAFTIDELAEADAALSRLVWNPGQRRTRRWVRGRGSRIDLRRAIAESLRTGGEVVKLGRRARRVRPRAASSLSLVVLAPEGRERPVEDRDLLPAMDEQRAACVIHLVAYADVHVSERLNDVE